MSTLKLPFIPYTILYIPRLLVIIFKVVRKQLIDYYIDFHNVKNMC